MCLGWMELLIALQREESQQKSVRLYPSMCQQGPPPVCSTHVAIEYPRSSPTLSANMLLTVLSVRLKYTSLPYVFLPTRH